MKRSEAISYLHKAIKKADEKQLKDLICATFSPLCSTDCPLKDKNSCECKKIIRTLQRSKIWHTVL